MKDKLHNNTTDKILEDINKHPQEYQREYIIYASKEIVNDFHNTVMQIIKNKQIKLPP